MYFISLNLCSAPSDRSNFTHCQNNCWFYSLKNNKIIQQFTIHNNLKHSQPKICNFHLSFQCFQMNNNISYVNKFIIIKNRYHQYMAWLRHGYLVFFKALHTTAREYIHIHLNRCNGFISTLPPKYNSPATYDVSSMSLHYTIEQKLHQRNTLFCPNFF